VRVCGAGALTRRAKKNENSLKPVCKSSKWKVLLKIGKPRQEAAESERGEFMISFQTNVTAMTAENNLSTNQQAESRAITRLTSGYRINSSGDDAAGLSVANQYRSNTAEVTQGVHNANDALSQLQIVDGGINNISNVLDRMKTLATESATSTFTGDRNILDAEYQTLLGEIDRQATNIGLNTGGALAANLSVYIGGGASPTVAVNLTTAVVDSTGLGVTGGDIKTTGTATTAIGKINAAIGKLGTAQGAVGAGENDLNYAVNLANSQVTSYSAANSTIRDADIATEAANLSKEQALTQASVAALAQANAMPQAVLKLLQ
jgi:flagellin